MTLLPVQPYDWLSTKRGTTGTTRTKERGQRLSAGRGRDISQSRHPLGLRRSRRRTSHAIRIGKLTNDATHQLQKLKATIWHGVKVTKLSSNDVRKERNCLEISCNFGAAGPNVSHGIRKAVALSLSCKTHVSAHKGRNKIETAVI